MKNLKLILKIYRLLPEKIRNNKRIVSFVLPIAEQELAETKHNIYKSKWKIAELEAQIKKYK